MRLLGEKLPENKAKHVTDISKLMCRYPGEKKFQGNLSYPSVYLIENFHNYFLFYTIFSHLSLCLKMFETAADLN